MKNRTISWTPFTDNLKETSALVDNELEISLKELGIMKSARFFGLRKKRGFELKWVMFAALIWPLLKARSLSFFSGNYLSAYISGGKDVLYDFLKRQDINWRGYRLHVAKRFYQKSDLSKEPIRAAVFDDTIKRRRGKKVSAVSSHYDHTSGAMVMGQQVLEMGLATPKAYAPLDSLIYVGKKKRRKGKNTFKDKRGVLAKAYKASFSENKNQKLRRALKRAVRASINFTHVLADSWFGNKENIKAVLSLSLVGIFRMRRGNLRYMLNGKPYTATELYAFIKRRLKKSKNLSWKTYSLLVDLDLSEDAKNPDLVPVRLLFSSPAKRAGGRETWAVFLSTDARLTPTKILEIYALRWSIEVYFKEIKQNLGFLKEQTGDYAVHYASIHLSAIRFILISHSVIESGGAFGMGRDKITRRLELLTFARLLWELFKALIHGILDSLKGDISSDALELIKKRLGSGISDFLDRALQLDDAYLQAEVKSEKLGVT